MAGQSAEVNISDSSKIGETSPSSPLLLDSKTALRDVYILRSRDHSGLNLTSDLLTRDNYFTWSLDIMFALEARGKDGFLLE